MAFPQGFLKRRVQAFWRRVDAIFEILGKQILVFFDNLVDECAMRFADRFEIAFTARVGQHVDSGLPVLGWQVENHAFVAEALPDVTE